MSHMSERCTPDEYRVRGHLDEWRSAGRTADQSQCSVKQQEGSPIQQADELRYAPRMASENVIYELLESVQSPNRGVVSRPGLSCVDPPRWSGPTQKLQSRPLVWVEAGNGGHPVIGAFGKPYLCKPFEVGVAIHKQSLGTGLTFELLRETVRSEEHTSE